MTSNRKSSLFNRWKQQSTADQLEGISEEEMIEYKEAFRLFDKVIQSSNIYSYFKFLY